MGLTHHEVQVNVVKVKALQRAVDALLDALVPWVVQLGGDPYLLTRDTGVLDTLTDLLLITIGKSSINVAVARLKGDLDSLANLTRLRLPCSKTHRRDLGASVEREVLLGTVLRCHSCKCTEYKAGNCDQLLFDSKKGDVVISTSNPPDVNRIFGQLTEDATFPTGYSHGVGFHQ